MYVRETCPSREKKTKRGVNARTKAREHLRNRRTRSRQGFCIRLDRLGAPAVAYKRAPRPGRLPLPRSCPSSINQLTSRKLNQTSPAIHLRHGTPQLRYVGCCFVIQSNLKSIGPYEIDHLAPTSESDLQEDEDSAPRHAAGRRLPRNRRRPLSQLRIAMAASWEDDRSYTASAKASPGAPATAWATGSSTSSPGRAPSKSAKLLLRRLRRRRRPSLTAKLLLWAYPLSFAHASVLIRLAKTKQHGGHTLSESSKK
jgi:hypothetical protein